MTEHNLLTPEDLRAFESGIEPTHAQMRELFRVYRESLATVPRVERAEEPALERTVLKLLDALEPFRMAWNLSTSPTVTLDEWKRFADARRPLDHWYTLRGGAPPQIEEPKAAEVSEPAWLSRLEQLSDRVLGRDETEAKLRAELAKANEELGPLRHFKETHESECPRRVSIRRAEAEADEQAAKARAAKARIDELATQLEEVRERDANAAHVAKLYREDVQQRKDENARLTRELQAERERAAADRRLASMIRDHATTLMTVVHDAAKNYGSLAAKLAEKDLKAAIALLQPPTDSSAKGEATRAVAFRGALCDACGTTLVSGKLSEDGVVRVGACRECKHREDNQRVKATLQGVERFIREEQSRD